MATLRRIGIAGAGLSGLAAALAAARAGAQVEVFEAAARLAAPPASIDVVPNMLRDLAALGVAEACVRKGFAYTSMVCVDAAGRTQFEIPAPSLAGAACPAAMGMGYADLLATLHEACVAQGVRLHWGARVERSSTHAGQARLSGAAGLLWQGDLAIVAGAASMLQSEPPLGATSQRLPQRWDHVLVARPRGIDRLTWCVGTSGLKVLVVPTGVAQAGLAVLCDDTPGARPAATPAALRQRLQQMGGAPAAMAALVRDDATVISRPVQTGLLSGPWHRGAVLRIGASAHLLPPHFGQAAAQSIEDAAVLGSLLPTAPDRRRLLAQFHARRTARAAQVHAITTQAALWDLHPEPATDFPALAQQLAPIVEHAA
ncbi:FAD-dependent monooxygenase [Ideonella alba]|uniref:NAD(P)-binding protein n=1 Tax=Ideonella alba TaxID=2824118 RepID=A0A940YGG5_9BURK|nr:FAD-dependent monooxygenase [Ideonella alba]MBQ0929519.1 NAD(P)-binding protein [Ideonella alba]